MRIQLLRSLYHQAAEGLPLLGLPAETAERVRRERGIDEAADRLINRSVVLSGATGFVCGLPGYVTMPLTIPSNVAGVLLIQLHLCATLAALGGRDPRDADVREDAIRCVLTSVRDDHSERSKANDRATPSPDSDLESETAENEDDEVTGLLSRVTTKLGERGVRFMGEQMSRWVGKAISHAGRGSRSLPLLGGAIGAVTDGVKTQSVGDRARRTFLDQQRANRH